MVSCVLETPLSTMCRVSLVLLQDGATVGESSTSVPPSASSTMTRSVSATVGPVHAAGGGSVTLPRSQSHGAAGGAAGGSLTLPRPVSQGSAESYGAVGGAPANMPNKPARTKRKAPAPPPPPGAVTPPITTTTSSNASSTTELTVAVHADQTQSSAKNRDHSRNSSHSSGFDEANMSPLESPGNSSRESTKTQESSKTKTSLDASSIDSSGDRPQAAAKPDVPPPIAEAASLKRKKRRAPPPPPPGEWPIFV